MSPSAYILSVKNMRRVKRLISVKTIIPLLLTLVGIPAAIRCSAECARGIGNGLAFCTDVLVPSLFIFMVLTAYLIKSGAAEMIAKPFGWLGRLMRLPREASAAVLLSMIGGYPIGAGCVALLYEEGRVSGSEAQKTALVAVAAGPGFVVSFVGKGLLGSVQAGNILLTAQIAAVLFTGLIVGRTVPCSPPPIRKRAQTDSAGAFVAAVRSAADATFSMCAMVVLFSAVIEVIASIADSGAADVLSAFLEITTGCSRLSGRMPLYLTAFFIGFGGISVHCQIFASLSDVPLNKPLFLLFRLIEGIIAMAAAYIFLMITPMELSVFSSSEIPATAERSATLAGSGALILAALCFIGSISSRMRRLNYVRNSRMAG